ncbi:MAG: lysozyme inhibitor LprI family protein [Pseudomonadota bacterium]
MKKFVFVCFLLSFAFASPSQAMLPACEKADSTSSIQNCLRNELEVQQERLNKIYNTIDTQFEEQEDKKELEELQQVWLDYRDQECMWESNHADTPALKNVSELSCMVKVTTNRANLLEAAYMDIDETQTRQHTEAPRWENALSNDHKGFIWEIDTPIMAELTCDEVDEIIVEGARYYETPNEEEEGLKAFAKNRAIAIVQNPAVGKPTIKLFEFTVFEKDEPDGICDDDLSYEFEKEEPVSEENAKAEEDAAPETCMSKIIVKQKKCTDKEIMWSGSEFVLHQVEDEEKEQSEK